MKKYIGLIFLVFLVSCKSKQSAVANTKPAADLSAEKVIASHKKLKSDFKTLYIKSDVRYRDEHQAQNVTAEIKIQKDEKILLSIRFLGITMAKALITPNEVKYYEKINSNYFEGDFRTLSRWLGTDLDFYKIQNMLVGKTLEDLSKGKYISTVVDNLYILSEDSKSTTEKAYYLESPGFLLKKQQIAQPSFGRKLQVSYNDYKNYSTATLPAAIMIEASQNNKITSISISNNMAVVNENLSFPYKVPSGYTKIIID